MSRLRRWLEQASAGVEICGIRGVGYLLRAPAVPGCRIMTADGLSDPPAGRRASLGRRLVWRLVLAQVGIQILVVGLLFVTGNLVEFSSQENTVEILQEAVARDASGALVLRDTPRLRGLRAEQPDLWAVLRDGQGRELRDGPVPPEFAAIGGALDGVGQARLGWNLGDPPRGTARMRKVETEAGRVAVLTGPASSITARNALIGAGLVLWKMVLPIALMTLAATLLATHLVVRRTLGGLRAAAEQAGRIDIDRRETRLPLGDVPEEAAALVRAVNGALARLDEGYARHQRFLADAAHELRADRHPEHAPGGLAGRAGARPPAGGRGAPVLAGQLLDARRLERDSAPLLPLDLVELVRGVTAELAPLAVGAGYQIAFESGAGPVTVAGDRPALERAVSNLVQNAIQHGGRRGVITLRVHGVRAVEVCDQGDGVPPGWREDIFKPFVKESPHSTGAGLGLNLVARIIRRHGGEVSVASGPDGGACFRLDFPEPGDADVAAELSRSPI